MTGLKELRINLTLTKHHLFRFELRNETIVAHDFNLMLLIHFWLHAQYSSVKIYFLIIIFFAQSRTFLNSNLMGLKFRLKARVVNNNVVIQ